MQLIFLWRSDCLGCAVLLCRVCLFDLACFFLPSFSSLIKTCTCSLPPSTPPTLITLLVAAEQSVERAEPPEEAAGQDPLPLQQPLLLQPPGEGPSSPSQTHYILQCIMSIFISCATYCCTRWRGGLVERETHDIVHMAHHKTLYYTMSIIDSCATCTLYMYVLLELYKVQL